jgi:hypothetical protein
MKREKSMSIRFSRMLILNLILCASFGAARGQVAGSPQFTLEQSVIAGGGGNRSAVGGGSSGGFSIDGSIGQAIAGTSSSPSLSSVSSGFWTPRTIAPTAAAVSVSGRVLTPDGAGLRNARVILTDDQGNSRITITASFGYYSFAEAVVAGQTVIITVQSKSYQFQPQIVTPLENVTELNFTPASGLKPKEEASERNLSPPKIQ